MPLGTLYRRYKLFTVYAPPVLAATAIFLDWFHTYQWKQQGRPVHPALRALYDARVASVNSSAVK